MLMFTVVNKIPISYDIKVDKIKGWDESWIRLKIGGWA